MRVRLHPFSDVPDESSPMQHVIDDAKRDVRIVDDPGVCDKDVDEEREQSAGGDVVTGSFHGNSGGSRAP
jgi:hypothetical protein